MTGQRDPSYADLVYDVLCSAEQPLTFQEIFTESAHAGLSNGAETDLSLDFLATGTWGCPTPEPLRLLLVERRAAADDALLIRIVDRIVDGEPNCREIHLESRLQRDKHAVAARNREIPDLAVHLYRERGSDEMPIWDLVILLLARGAYRSDVAPDPLDTILEDDPRFEHAGHLGWVLAETMTPAKRAEIRQRQQTEAELLAAISGTGGLIEQRAAPLNNPLHARARHD